MPIWRAQHRPPSSRLCCRISAKWRCGHEIFLLMYLAAHTFPLCSFHPSFFIFIFSLFSLSLSFPLFLFLLFPSFPLSLSFPLFNLSPLFNKVGARYRALLAGDGLDADNMRHRVKDFSLSGGYRRPFARPRNVSWLVKENRESKTHRGSEKYRARKNERKSADFISECSQNFAQEADALRWLHKASRAFWLWAARGRGRARDFTR